ncbi:MAG: LamG domain-containing protein [Ignavibacteriae bacterium]|nr:LamG domain-containing protein [Ignavibacteriota bacterium]
MNIVNSFFGKKEFPPTPFAFYKFNEGSGFVANSEISSRPLTLNHDTYWKGTSGREGDSVRVNLSTEYLTLGGSDTDDLLVNNAFSICKWFTYAQGNSVSIGTAGGTRVVTAYPVGGHWRVMVGNNAGNWVYTTTSTSGILAGWHHFALTVDINSYHLYFNGVLVATASYTANSFKKIGQSMMLLGNTYAGSRTIDNLVLYSRKLDVDEVNAVMNLT